MAKKDKFTKYVAFREALYRGLFNHTIGTAGVGRADIPSLAGPLNAAEALSLPIIKGTGGASIKHQRIGMKRGPCVVCKQAAAEKRRGISVGGKKGRALQDISPNITSKSKDKHISRATTGCSACEVLLCTTRGCWEAFHRDNA